MAIAAKFDLEVYQYDVVTAFLNATKKGGVPVTCELPNGYKDPEWVIKLERALYGLRDSFSLWYKKFASTLKKLGLLPSPKEPCLFYNKERSVLLVFFVDDILLLYHKDHQAKANELIRNLKSIYELKDQGEVN